MTTSILSLDCAWLKLNNALHSCLNVICKTHSTTTKHGSLPAFFFFFKFYLYPVMLSVKMSTAFDRCHFIRVSTFDSHIHLNKTQHHCLMIKHIEKWIYWICAILQSSTNFICLCDNKLKVIVKSKWATSSYIALKFT